MDATWLSPIVLWLATYVVHSTLLLLAVWGLTRLPGLRAPRRAEVLWRTALLGAIVTASLHAFVGAPLWRIESGPVTSDLLAVRPVAPPVEASPPRPLGVAPIRRAPSDVPGTSAEASQARRRPAPTSPSACEGGRHLAREAAQRLPAPAASLGSAPSPPASVAADVGALRPVWLLLLWPLGAAVLLVRRSFQRRALSSSLAGRRPVREAEIRARVGRLARSAGVRRPVRLTASATLSSPIAFGVRRPEICLPRRALDVLPVAHLDAMLAHEVAHVARQDAAWLVVVRAVTTLFFFQPLNLLAARRLRDASELLCDAWAAQREGRRLALAACLTTVAEWITERAAPQGVSAMALRPSLLGRRVHHLLAPRERASAQRSGAAWCVAATVLLVVALCAPGIAAAPRASSATHAQQGVRPRLTALDADLTALDTEVGEVLELLQGAGRADLADRLLLRLRALREERARFDKTLHGNEPTAR